MNNPIPSLSSAQSDALRESLTALLAAQAARYTDGASGSLPKETMDELLVSALYTLSVDPTRPESFYPLVGQDIFACFARAQARLVQKRDAALALAASLCLHTDDLGCIALHTTLSSLLEGLKRYDAVFFAHRVPGDIDYQLCLPVSESLMGVDYALRYLQNLALEGELLARFPVHRVLALLDGVSSRWRALVCNLLTPVLENAMALVLLDRPPHRLHVSSSDRAALLAMFAGRTQSELARLFDRAAARLAQTLLPNRADALLVCQTLAKQLAPRVFEAARREDLSHVFFSFGVPRRVTSCSKG